MENGRTVVIYGIQRGVRAIVSVATVRFTCGPSGIYYVNAFPFVPQLINSRSTLVVLPFQ
jgi:hypothetical protein